jgi:hypothetical protein
VGAPRAEYVQSPYAHAALGLALEWRPAEGAYRLLGRGRKLLHELDRCVIEARIARNRLLLEKPFGHMPWSPQLATYCPLHTSRRLHAARSRRRYATELLRRLQGRRSWRGNYAVSNRTQEDLRPAASGKAQPREAPLEVVVVQLQQSQPASLAV